MHMPRYDENTAFRCQLLLLTKCPVAFKPSYHFLKFVESTKTLWSYTRNDRSREDAVREPLNLKKEKIEGVSSYGGGCRFRLCSVVTE